MPCLLLIITLRFTCGKSKIWRSIKKPQNNISGTVATMFTSQETTHNFLANGMFVMKSEEAWPNVIWAFWAWKVISKFYLFFKETFKQTIITDFLQKQSPINMAFRISKLIQGDVYFLRLLKTYTLDIFIYLFTNNFSHNLLCSFESPNRFLNTLCGKHFNWLKTYKDILKTPGNIDNGSYLQN